MFLFSPLYYSDSFRSVKLSITGKTPKRFGVFASESNNGCQLFAQPESMAMRAFNETPIMRSGNQQEDLGIDATTYNRVEITLKNPNTSGQNPNLNAILFVYPPESNDKICS